MSTEKKVPQAPTYENFVNALKHVVSGYEDYKYSADLAAGGCVYQTRDGYPSCLIGYALHHMGYSLDGLDDYADDPDDYIDGLGCAFSLSALVVLRDLDFSDDAARLAQSIQDDQDSGLPWGECLQNSISTNERY